MCISFDFSHIIGQLVQHNTFGYRGGDVNPDFQGANDGYDQLTQAPKNKFGYRVLIDDQDNKEYVAERHLEPDAFGEPVVNSYIGLFFDSFENSKYVSKNMYN